MKTILIVAGVAVLMLCAPAIQATTVTFDETTFVPQLQSYYLEDFSGYTWFPLATTENYGPVNGFSWSAFASQGLWANSSALSTNNATDTIAITLTGAPVTAIGGIFASTDIDGNTISQTISVLLSDGTTASVTGSGFIGFVSAVPITGLIVDAVDGPEVNWPQLDHFYVGTTVPEPASMLLLGGGLLGFAAKRLRRR